MRNVKTRTYRLPSGGYATVRTSPNGGTVITMPDGTTTTVTTRGAAL